MKITYIFEDWPFSVTVIYKMGIDFPRNFIRIVVSAKCRHYIKLVSKTGLNTCYPKRNFQFHILIISFHIMKNLLKRIQVSTKVGLGKIVYKDTLDKVTSDFNDSLLDPFTDRSILIEHQIEMIKSWCNQAYYRTNYYKSQFDDLNIDFNSITSLDDINNLPKTNRNVLKNNSDDLLLMDRKFPFYNLYTSGSTGEKMVIKRNINDSILLLAVCRIFKELGLDKNSNYRFIFPKQSSTWNSEIGFRINYPNLELMTPQRLEHLLETDHSELEKIDGIFTYTRLIAGVANRHPHAIKYLRPKGVIFSGEIFNDGTKSLYKKYLPDTQIMNIYSSIEKGWMSMQCKCGNMHIMEDLYYPEILYKDENGVGELHMTFMHPLTTMLLRYDTGDLVKEVDCDCGWNWRAIEILGRSKDEIHKHLTRNQILDAIDSTRFGKYLFTENVGIETKFESDTTKYTIYIEKNNMPERGIEERIKRDILSFFEKKGIAISAYKNIGIWKLDVELIDKGDLLRRTNYMPGKMKIYSRTQ